LVTNNIKAQVQNTINITGRIYSYNDIINTGTITYYIDDIEIGKQEVKENKATLTYTLSNIFTENNHRIRLEYNGNNIYQSTNTTSTLNLTKHSTIIQLKNRTITNNSITAKVLSYNDTINEGTIEFTINNKTIGKQQVQNNTATIKLPDEYTNESYNMTITYLGTNKYTPSTTNNTIKIQKTQTNIWTSKYKASPEEQIEFTAKIYPNTITINKGTVIFILNNSIINQTEVKENKATITYKLPNTYIEGEYSIVVNYTGSEEYTPSSYTSSLIISKKNTQLITQPLTTQINKKTMITARIYSNNDTINEGTIIFSINNNTTIVKVQNNTATLNYTPTITGLQTIKINYTGSNIYQQTDKTTTINIEKQNTTMIIFDKNTTINRKTMITAYVYNYNNTINEGTIIFSTNNTTIGTAPVKENKASINYTPNKIGKQEINVKFLETENYTSSNNSCILTITKQTVLLWTPPINTNKTTINITAKIYSYNDTINEGTIEYYIDNIIIGKAQVENNTAKLEYKPQIIGLHQLTIKYPETKNYQTNNYTTNITITSNKKEAILTTNPIISEAGENISIKALLTENNNLITQKTAICIKINQKTIGKANITNGILEYNYTIPSNYHAKIYNITIIAGTNNKYNTATTNTTLTLIKSKQYIITDNITTNINEKIIIKALITDINQELIKNTKICIKIDQKTIINLKNVNGTINYEYLISSVFKPGKHIITIITGENNKYDTTIKNTTLTVTKNIPKITTIINPQKEYYNLGDTITINYTINTNNTNNTPIKTCIKINQKTVSHNKTMLTYIIPKNYKYNTLNLTFITGSTQNNQKTTTNRIIKIKRD
ncbi:MAG: Ig-like domain-containing protein, partial [Methanobacteriaceae archaeon]|nr:Ig-like domain-containing protein [Methanobacteriaceae archaeon]